ncbi:MAG: hypothetical protein JEY94_12165 [Melioribacteraceae bacterium]|nr:hypothetical protein [Melioribacteraceae bacterium]
MNNMLGKYSFGVGDRFNCQAEAQLKAIIEAKNKFGCDITPVWNKSYREHTTIGSKPMDTRIAVDKAVNKLGWSYSYFVDADHVNAKIIDQFIGSCDFFTIDVADYIGAPIEDAELQSFLEFNSKYIGNLVIPGIKEVYNITEEMLCNIAKKYLTAVIHASKLYKIIKENKKDDSYVIEVSMDETEESQTPIEMFFILSGLSMEGVPVNTIAPKFNGRFNKGVNYVGDLNKFEKEFDEDILVLKYAIAEFGFPDGLKLSVHSGSDKFDIYPIMNKLIKKHDIGLHVKTAGTTWLEEVIGLSQQGGDGLKFAQEVYSSARERFFELTSPYSTVIDIDETKLPTVSEVNLWTSEKFSKTLEHNLGCEDYNVHFRQLIHVAYKIAAENGSDYIDLLLKYKKEVGSNVAYNILERHIKPIFI